MSCYHPLLGLKTPDINLDTGKHVVKVYSGLEAMELAGKKWPAGYETFPVPCGRCIGCRLDHSRQWADRCMLELMYHEKAVFITLTYDSAHAPRRFYAGDVFGSPKPCFTLSQRDLQLFFKRLRKKFGSCTIRYFGCGEYGPRTLRPHYHVILFGVDFPDKVPMDRKSKTGHMLYRSDILDSLWSFPVRDELGKYDSPHSTNAGLCTIQDVTWETCAYTARYVMKKQYGDEAKFYKKYNLDPPFSCMSRRPGIGAQYLADHPNLFDYQYINVSTADGGRKVMPPKYFLNRLEITEPEKADALRRVRRQLALERQMCLESELQIPYVTYLNQQEAIKLNQIKSLQRGGV